MGNKSYKLARSNRFNPIVAALPIRHLQISLAKICDNTTKVYFLSTDNVFLPL